MRAAPLASLAVLSLLGCAADLGPAGAWVPWQEISGPLRPEVQAPPPATATGLRLVSYNVHYGEDVPALARAIAEDPVLRGADLLLLQEIESHPGEGGSRAARLAGQLGLGYLYVPGRLMGDGTHGLALLGRLPCADLRVMELPQAALAGVVERRVAFSCEVQLGAARVRVFNVHLDTRLNLGQRIQQLRPVLLDPPERAILAGDFNTSDYSFAGGALPDLPVSTATGVSQADGLADYVGQWGFSAPTRDFGPTQRAVVVDLRLDAIYLRGLQSRGGAVQRQVSASDHWPLWLDIAVAP